MKSLRLLCILYCHLSKILGSAAIAPGTTLVDKKLSFEMQYQHQQKQLLISDNTLLKAHKQLPCVRIERQIIRPKKTSKNPPKSFDQAIKERLEEQKRLKLLTTQAPQLSPPSKIKSVALLLKLAQINADFECAASLASLSPDQSQTTPEEPPTLSLDSHQPAVAESSAHINQRPQRQAGVKAAINLKNNNKGSNKRKNHQGSPEQPEKKAKAMRDAEQEQNGEISPAPTKQQNKKKKRA